MSHPSRACKRCGIQRTTTGHTPDYCTACRAAIRQGEHTTEDHIDWNKRGLIYRGTVQPPKDPRP